MDIMLADNRTRMKKQKSFHDAVKQKYCIDQDEQPTTFGIIIMSPKRKNGAAEAELAHLKTVVLNGMNLNLAGIPQQGLKSLCPNIVDLDLANNLFCHWSELLAILTHLPKVKYVNVSRNTLKLDCADELPKTELSVENLALNDTGVAIQEVIHVCQIMPVLKEIHLCDNKYEVLDDVDESIKNGNWSTLECLRLNNNNINSWSEVWKLRGLPQLKRLILSGNPLTSIFYSNDPEISFDVDEELHLTRKTAAANRPSHQNKNQGISDDEMFHHLSNTDYDHLDSNDIEVEFQDLSFSTLEYEDGDHDDRPYSRITRHDDSIVTDDDDGCLLSDKEDCGNVNYNNSGLLQQNSYFHETSEEDSGAHYGFPSQEDFDAAVDAAVMESLLETEAMLEDDEDEWYKAEAEAFLQEIIDNLVADQVSEGLTSTLHEVEVNHVDENPTLAGADQDAERLTPTLHDFINPILEDVMTAALQCVVAAKQDISNVEALTDDNSDSVMSDCMSVDVVREPSFQTVHASESTTIGFSVSTNQTCTDRSTDQRFPNNRLSGDLVKNNTQTATVKDVLISNHPASSESVQNSTCDNHSTKHSHMSEDTCQNSECGAQNTSNYNQNSTCDSISEHSAVVIPSIDNVAISDSIGGAPATDVPSTDTVASCSPSTDTVASCPSVADSETFRLQAHTHSHAQRNLFGADGSEVKETDQLDVDKRETDSASETRQTEKNLSGKPCDATRTTSGLSRPDTTKTMQNDSPVLNKTENSAREVDSGASAPGCQCNTVRQPRESTLPRESTPPFHQLENLCLSEAKISHWKHLQALQHFPQLASVRLLENPLYSSVKPDDRRKLYISSLPKVTFLNGSEVTINEREKAERYYLRHFMDSEDKPEIFHKLVAKHGPPVRLVEVDLSAGYREYVSMTFIFKDTPQFNTDGKLQFTKKIHMHGRMGSLRNIVAREMKIHKSSFIMLHSPCGPAHPEYDREIIELRCEGLPLSRFDFLDGDEIHIKFSDFPVRYA